MKGYILVWFLLSPLLALFASGQSEPVEDMTPWEPYTPMEGEDMAVFAGGCFWGVEGVFEALEGVVDVQSGYSGGKADTARYSLVSSGNTSHAEAVQVIYNPEIISYETLLEIFFNIAHDPTQLNFQGPDRGTQYRSAIFYSNEKQKEASLAAIKRLNVEKFFNSMVTEVVPLEAFYPAEEYHQDFMRLNPTQSYIVYWDLPKLEHLQKAYPDLLKN